MPYKGNATLPRVVQRGAMRTMANPPTPQNVRLTITVTPEVHAAFSRMAEVTGMSLGRCMGEWLADTQEGAEMLTSQLLRAREAPKQVIREMRQGLLGVLDQTDNLLADIRAKEARKAGPAGDAGAPRPGRPQPPRPVIRGGKSRQGTQARRGPAGQSGTTEGGDDGHGNHD